MHTSIRRLCGWLALGLLAGWSMPLWAQQPSGQAPRQRAAQPGTRQAAPRVSRTPNRASAPGVRAGQAARQPSSAGQTVAPPGSPREPFRLTPQQAQLLHQILVKWENESARVRTFKCTFGRWKTNVAFGPKENNHLLSEAHGVIKFKAPDHGIYIVKTETEWEPTKKAYVKRTEGLDHWVCNGKAIFEYNADRRQLIERRLAPELQGKAITDGPLPFIFGAKADQLQRRYWMRDVTPPEEVNKKIRLEAWPKFQRDAANFKYAIVILSQRTFLPEALRIILPDGKNTEDYAFQGTLVNDPLSILKGDFLPPITPFGWQKVVEPAGGRAAAAAKEPAGAPKAETASRRAKGAKSR